MLQRTVNRLLTYGFFLVGARGTGKSAFARVGYLRANRLYVKLLLDDLFDRKNQQIDGVVILPWRQAVEELMR